MELFLASVLTGSHATRLAMCDRQKSSRPKMQDAGSEKHLELGRKSMWLGSWIIAYANAVTLRVINTC
jgi:hypothetical protein